MRPGCSKGSECSPGSIPSFLHSQDCRGQQHSPHMALLTAWDMDHEAEGARAPFRPAGSRRRASRQITDAAAHFAAGLGELKGSCLRAVDVVTAAFQDCAANPNLSFQAVYFHIPHWTPPGKAKTLSHRSLQGRCYLYSATCSIPSGYQAAQREQHPKILTQHHSNSKGTELSLELCCKENLRCFPVQSYSLPTSCRGDSAWRWLLSSCKAE